MKYDTREEVAPSGVCLHAEAMAQRHEVADLQRELEMRQRLGARIRTLRLQKGLNQDDFAALVGIHRTHPGKLENAKIDPRLSTLVRIADALDLPLRELMDIA